MTSPLAMPAASATAEALRVAGEVGVDVTGAWAFTVMHGDIEDAGEAAALEDLCRRALSTGHLLGSYGTNDTTAWVFAAAGGRIATLAMQGQAILTGRSWWRTHTRFGGDA